MLVRKFYHPHKIYVRDRSLIGRSLDISLLYKIRSCAFHAYSLIAAQVVMIILRVSNLLTPRLPQARRIHVKEHTSNNALPRPSASPPHRAKLPTSNPLSPYPPNPPKAPPPQSPNA